MVNSLYDKGRQKFLEGSINWLSDDIKVILIDTDDYTVDLVNDEFLSDIPVAARVATSSNLTSKTTTAGVADADNVDFGPITGDESEAIVIFKDVGVDSASPLIAYIDSGSGLPVQLNGGNRSISWSDGDNKIFKL